jgi:hypothetical protein
MTRASGKRRRCWKRCWRSWGRAAFRDLGDLWDELIRSFKIIYKRNQIPIRIGNVKLLSIRHFAKWLDDVDSLFGNFPENAGNVVHRKEQAYILVISSQNTASRWLVDHFQVNRMPVFFNARVKIVIPEIQCKAQLLRIELNGAFEVGYDEGEALFV